jgi:hypothetical protein
MELVVLLGPKGSNDTVPLLEKRCGHIDVTVCRELEPTSQTKEV